MIEIDNVSSVYSGKPGCACGCRGKYAYASRHRAWASKDRGYTVTADEVNDRTVKLMVNKINKAIASGADVKRYVWGVSFETDTRVYVLYFRTK